MTAFQMFKSAKVRRLEVALKEERKANSELWEGIVEKHKELVDMTEARDAVAAASKFLRDRCDMQAKTLLMIAKHGEDNPNWAARIARATLETKTGIYKEGPKTAIQVGTEFAESLKESFRRSNTESKGE